MILHGVPVENQFLHNADTLDEDWPTQEPTNFDGVLMNPPYSAKWSASSGFMADPRFSPFGKLAPQSKADFAFLLHGYYHLKQDNGVMAIVLPHGVLFRGNAEGTIRKALLEEGAIDTVIGLQPISSLIPVFRPRLSFSKRTVLIVMSTLSMLLRSLIRGKTRIS